MAIRRWAALILGIFFLTACSRTSARRTRLRQILKIPAVLKGVEVVENKTWISKDLQYSELLMRFEGASDLKAFSVSLASSSDAGLQPAILILHGHFSEAGDFIGLTASSNVWPVGVDLARQGYFVLAPQARGDYQNLKNESRLAFKLLMEGQTLMGTRVTDAMRWLSYLKINKSSHRRAVGLLGWSMGGNMAMYLAALSDDVDAVYLSSAFDSLEILSQGPFQSPDNYVPDILSFGDKDQIAALIAPRPLLIEQGQNDPVAPFEGAVKMSERLKNVYRRSGFDDRVIFLRHEQGHRFLGSDVLVWFKRWIPANAH